jgi:Xaa-Pro aminopeptidase
MIDLHPVVAGYSADMCRTVCVGKPTAEQQSAARDPRTATHRVAKS